MAFVKDYTRINWVNYTSTDTPVNAINLNKMDYAIDKIEDYIVVLDTTKAQQSELLSCLGNYTDDDEVLHEAVEYDSTTGQFVFNFKNGQQITVDLNIEKIPVSFTMSESGVITMTTTDGSTYTADVGALIKTYTFTDSSTIDFTVTTDASGNKNVTANIIDGSITGDKLEPNYLANCVTAKDSAVSASNSAGVSEVNASNSAEDSEAWACGTRGGVPVPSTDETYHNNAKYYAEQGQTIDELNDIGDVDITNPANNDVLKYNSTSGHWENGAGGGGGNAEWGEIDGDIEAQSDLIAKFTALDNAKANKPTTLTATLTAGQTTLTFTNAAITANAFIDVYVWDGVCAPIDMDTSVAGTVSLLFAKQTVDVDVALVIR